MMVKGIDTIEQSLLQPFLMVFFDSPTGAGVKGAVPPCKRVETQRKVRLGFEGFLKFTMVLKSVG